MEMTLKLPWPPSVNTYWRHVVIKGAVRNLISARGREYRKTCAGYALAQGAVLTNLQGPLAVHIQACPPDRRQRDLDNLPKGLLDALTHAKVWGDDSQIDDLRIIRGRIVKGGLVSVLITPIIDGETQK